MAISQLYPNQRPTLNLNFARSKTLDPRITFSRGNCEGTYVGSDGLIKTAAVDEPRFDHDPVTGECRGLLIEESRTNSVPNGTSLGSFSANGNSLVSGESAPDGSTTAVTYTQSQSQGLRQTVTGTSGQQTVSVFAKAGTSSIIRLNFWDGSYGGARFDLSNGTIVSGSVDSGWTAHTPVDYGNGWYRCAITRNVVNTTSPEMWIWETQAGVTNQTLKLWGAQIEAGPFPTSYIPTSGSTCTRNGDDAEMSGTNVTSWYNIPEGTVYSEGMSPLDLTTSRLVWHFRDPGRKEHNADDSFQWFDAGYGLTNGTTYAAGTINKQAYSYSNVVPGRPCLNGILRPQFIANTSPYAHTTLSLGSNVGTNIFLNGYIQRFAYYPTRLTDSQLQELTS